VNNPPVTIRAVVVDTQVISWLAKSQEKGASYRRLLGDRLIALSFFVRTELDGYEWSEARRARLELVYAACVALPPSEATRSWYNRTSRKRTELGLSSRVDDNDCWIIAQALEFDLPLMTHDAGVAQLAAALGVTVETTLSGSG
jgi:predicted nucleic acid-binding protein